LPVLVQVGVFRLALLPAAGDRRDRTFDLERGRGRRGGIETLRAWYSDRAGVTEPVPSPFSHEVNILRSSS
jgi:hypothetical protein